MTHHIVGRLEAEPSGMPVILENKLVPRRDQVGDGTSGIRLAERNPAVHAAGGLHLELLRLQTAGHFLPVFRSLSCGPVCFSHSLVLHETTNFVELGSSSDCSLRVCHGILYIGDRRFVTFGADGLFDLRVERDQFDSILAGFFLRSPSGFRCENALVVERHDPDKATQHTAKVLQDSVRNLRSREVEVLFHQRFQKRDFLAVCNGTEFDHFAVYLRAKLMRQI